MLDEEKLKIEQHTQNLRELADQQIIAETERANAVKNVFLSEIQNFQGSSAEYVTLQQGQMATMNELKNQKIAMIEQQTNEEAVLIQKRHTDANTMNSVAYTEEMRILTENKRQKLESANTESADFLTVQMNKYTELTGLHTIYQQNEATANAAVETEKARHTQSVNDIQDIWFMDLVTKDAAIEHENKVHNDKLKDIYAQGTNNLSKTQLAQSGELLAMAVDTVQKGGKISGVTKDAVNLILDDWENLPAESKEIMANTLDPMLKEMGLSGKELANASGDVGLDMIQQLQTALGVNSPSWKTKEAMNYVMQGAEQGLEEKRGSLLGRAASIAQSVISTIANAFKIKSPSRVMSEMFGYVMKGAENGLSDNEKSLLKTASKVTANVLAALTPQEISTFHAEMKASVAQSHAATSANRCAQADINAAKISSFFGKIPKPPTPSPSAMANPDININLVTQLDGRTVYKNQQSIKPDFGHPIGGNPYAW